MLFYVISSILFVITYRVCSDKISKVFFEPYTLFSIFQFGYFIFRPCVILFHEGNSYFPGLTTAYLTQNVYFSSLVGVIFYILTSLFYKLASKINLNPLSFWFVPEFKKQVNQRILNNLNVFLLLIFIINYLNYLDQYGSIGTLMLNLRTGDIVGAYSLKILPQFLALLAAFNFFVSIINKQGRLISALFFLISLFCVALTGDRSGIIVPILLIYISLTYSRRKINLYSFLFFVLFSIISLHVLNEIRSLIIFDSTVSKSTTPDWSYILTRALNLQAFDYFLVINQYANLETLKLGEDFKNGLIGFIPRNFWVEKPEIINDGVWFSKQFFGTTKIGRPYTLLGVWYLNFHFLGIFFGAALSAFIMSATSKYIDSVSGAISFFYASLITLIFASQGWSPSLPINYIKFILPIIIIFKFLSIRFK